jgi:hypothetical protein
VLSAAPCTPIEPKFAKPHRGVGRDGERARVERLLDLAQRRWRPTRQPLYESTRFVLGTETSCCATSSARGRKRSRKGGTHKPVCP